MQIFQLTLNYFVFHLNHRSKGFSMIIYYFFQLFSYPNLREFTNVREMLVYQWKWTFCHSSLLLFLGTPEMAWSVSFRFGFLFLCTFVHASISVLTLTLLFQMISFCTLPWSFYGFPIVSSANIFPWQEQWVNLDLHNTYMTFHQSSIF